MDYKIKSKEVEKDGNYDFNTITIEMANGEEVVIFGSDNHGYNIQLEVFDDELETDCLHAPDLESAFKVVDSLKG